MSRNKNNNNVAESTVVAEQEVIETTEVVVAEQEVVETTAATTEQAEETVEELATIDASWTIGDPKKGTLRTETRPTMPIHVPTLQAIAEAMPDGATAQDLAMMLATHDDYKAEFLPLYHDLVASNLLSIDLNDGNGSRKKREQADAMRAHDDYKAFLPEDGFTYVDGDRRYYRLWPYAGNCVGVLLVGISDPKNAWTPTLAAMATALIGRFEVGGNFKSALTIVEPGIKAPTGRKVKGKEAAKGNGFGMGLLSSKLAALSKK